jgi:ABC-type branched-subunit amino acid transport system substrate-binding protein
VPYLWFNHYLRQFSAIDNQSPPLSKDLQPWRELMKRWMLVATCFCTATISVGAVADTPGVTATEVKIGNTMPYSGPVSSYSPIGKLDSAFFNMINEQGGVAGHKVNFISLDDGYSPPKTVEQVRRLVEEDQVAFLFNTLGTPTNSAIVRYVNQKKVPHLFVATGAAKWGAARTIRGRLVFSPTTGPRHKFMASTF